MSDKSALESLKVQIDVGEEILRECVKAGDILGAAKTSLVLKNVRQLFSEIEASGDYTSDKVSNVTLMLYFMIEEARLLGDQE